MLLSITACLCLLATSACDKSAEPTETPDTAHAEHGEGHHAEGHEGHHEKGEGMDHDHGDIEGKPVVAKGEAQVGDVTLCPVSGEKFEVTDDSPSFEHEGKTYYFCCAGCKGKAEAEPEKYLAAAE